MTFLLAALLCGGCAAPPLFQPVANAPADRAVVYFYGPPDMLYVRSNVRHASTRLVNIDPNLYYAHLPPAGTNYYVIPPLGRGMADWFLDKQTPGVVPVRTEAGKSYYFRVVGMGSLLRVDNTTGAKEIAACRLAKGAKPDTVGVFEKKKDLGPPTTARGASRGQ
jgi:hypothetical protein